MVIENQNIITTHPVKRSGVSIPQSRYELISNFIIENIRSSEIITLAMLLTNAGSQFKGDSDISWYIYHVKLDLEARGFIKKNNKTNSIKLSAAGQKYFRSKSPHKSQK